MRLLIVTQKVDIDDNNLGFFHRWLEKFAETADLVVIANYVGRYRLPKNVEVISLGKEARRGFWYKFFIYQRLLLKYLPRVDKVFFHMCPEYVLAAGLWPQIFRKQTILWYTHKKVDLKLRMAASLVNKIYTASLESFRLKSKKVRVTGHGIDLDKFKHLGQISSAASSAVRIITAGRIAPVKNYEILLAAAKILLDKKFNFEIKIAGEPITKADHAYLEKLKEIESMGGLRDKVDFIGPVSYREMDEFYNQGDIFINLSDTGSIDKVVLEAMACNLQILTSNEAFKKILPSENFTTKDAAAVADKIILLSHASVPSFRNYVAANHNLNNLARLITESEKLNS